MSPLLALSGQSLRRNSLSAFGGDLNGSTQHFIFNGKDGVCGDQSKISSRLHCGRENGVVGALAAGESLKAIGRAFGKPSSSIYCQVAPHGGDSSCTTASLAVGIDGHRARGDIDWAHQRRPAQSTRAFPEKTESRDSPAGTNRIQGSCWNGGQHGWRNRIRKICVRASLERDRMALLFRRLRSNLE